MKHKAHFLWIIPAVLIGLGAAGVITVAGLIATPAVRQKILNKGIEIASEKTGYDIELHRLYLSPFHQRPSTIFSDSVVIEIDTLFIGHANQDTLLYLDHLALSALPLAKDSTLSSIHLRDTIPVFRLALDNAVAHTDSLIEAVKIDANIGRLRTQSPGIVLDKGAFPLHGLRLADADVAITLNDTPEETEEDTTTTLMAFDVPDGRLDNFRFRLLPMGLDVATQSLQTTALADVGHNLYDVPSLHIGNGHFRLGSLSIPIDTLHGDARVDLDKQLITSNKLRARCDSLKADLGLSATYFDLDKMWVRFAADAKLQGNSAHAQGTYNIEKEAYDLTANLHHFDLSPFLGDSTVALLSGTIKAKGQGLDITSPRMFTEVQVDLPKCVYNEYDLSGIRLEAAVKDTVTSCNIALDQLAVNVRSPKHLSSIMKAVDSLKTAEGIDSLLARVPSVDVGLHVGEHTLVQPIVAKYGVDLRHLDAALHIDSDVRPKLADVTVSSDGLVATHGAKTDYTFQTQIHRKEPDIFGDGAIHLNGLSYDTLVLNDHTIDFTIEPSLLYPKGAFMLRANLDDIPLDLVDSILKMPDIDLSGNIRAGVTIDGLPSAIDMSAHVQPIGVKALYKPYEVEIGLGQTPITMEHNNIQFNGLPVYGIDSTFIALNGGLNLDSSYLDVTFASDSFAPVRLRPNGPIPVYGNLAAAIQGQVKGPLSHFDADVDVDILPVTDLTYPIDEKNFAQIFPTGKVHAHYADSLDLSGTVYVNKGTVKYSPKAYPMLPFQVDSGSYARLNGSIGATELSVSASQAVKADVQSEGEQSRRVDFNAGVRVNGPLDSLGINSIGFFLEAPHDDQITQELSTKTKEDKNGLAMVLLGTGMYVGESNVAAQKDGYAVSSILNSKINAAMENSKAGKVVDIDLSSGEKIHGNNVKTKDIDLTISKSFFKDKLRVSLGSTLSDNPEISKTQGLLSSIKAEYKLVPSGNVLAHVFSRKDYDNVLEGELNKSGLGVRAFKDWKRPVKDSLEYTYSIAGDVDLIYRSNNSLGPDGALTLGVRNLMGNNEALSLKMKGAYYWSLNKNFPGDPRNKNTYKLGADLSFVLPYLHWGRDDAPQGSTRYIVGYQYENIAGGYDIHKISGSFTYFIRSGKYITHAFTPFSLSGVKMKAASPDLKEKAADYPELVAVIVGDELVPAIGYNFTYDNYRSERVVNTFFDWDIKESGNLINALCAIGGKKWNDKGKLYDQFVKTTLELRNKFNITPTICFATRLFAGGIIPLGNSSLAPMSERFHAGGTTSMRFAAPNSYGPGDFFSPKYNQALFHTGDFKLEANVEFRFPIVWKLRGAVFADVGNVWNWEDLWDSAERIGEEDFMQKFGFTDKVEDGFRIENLGKQLALGTGLGLRVDIESIVVRLDIGVGLHLPYQTYKYDKQGNMTDEPITKYYNIPTVYDGLRFSFGIGYPF